MKTRTINYKYNIESIIEDNLNMQSVQRELYDLGIFLPSAELFKRPDFRYNIYNNFTKEQKRKFLKLVGGVKYFNLVKRLIENGDK